jgi:hypothetical protein
LRKNRKNPDAETDGPIKATRADGFTMVGFARVCVRDVWLYSSQASSRTIDVHISWLRQKIEENTQHPKHIHTIRGKGYRFSL